MLIVFWPIIIQNCTLYKIHLTCNPQKSKFEIWFINAIIFKFGNSNFQT